MPRIDELFKPHTAKSSGFKKHANGDFAYVTNGFRNNGVVGFVNPLPDDFTCSFLGIVLSTFCEATVQIPPFIPRGNGGSGLMVLEPINPMTADELGYVAAYINTSLRWRFNWYRQATVDKIRSLQIPDPSNSAFRFPVKSFLPKTGAVPSCGGKRLNLKPFGLDQLFDMSSGDFHNAGELPEGDIPLVSCGARNNGIVSFVDVPSELTHRYKMTISFNGMNTLATKFHPYQFAAKDDVAVCVARKPLRPSTLFFIQIMMGREKWRYSFYRKCFMEKLCRQTVNLPAVGKSIDEDAIASTVATAAYWPFLEPRYRVPVLEK